MIEKSTPRLTKTELYMPKLRSATDAAAADSNPSMSFFLATLQWGSNKIIYLSAKSIKTLKLLFI